MLKKSKLRIIISGYDVANTEEATKIIAQQVFQLKRDFSGPIPKKTKRKLITVPISPHKHKDSQEQFERRIHRRLIEITNPQPEDLVKLNKLTVPHTVLIQVKEIFLV